MPFGGYGASDAVYSQVLRFDMEPKWPEIVRGQMAKILVVVYDKHVKPVGFSRRNAWCLGGHGSFHDARFPEEKPALLLFADNFKLRPRIFRSA
jgi:hypothetical protein